MKKLSLQTAQIWAEDMKKFCFEQDPDSFWLTDIPIIVIDEEEESDRNTDLGYVTCNSFTVVLNLNNIKVFAHDLIEKTPSGKVNYGGDSINLIKDIMLNIIIHEMLHIHQYLPHYTKYMNRKRKLAHDMLFYEDDVRYMTLQFIIKNLTRIHFKYPRYKGADFNQAIISFYNQLCKQTTTTSITVICKNILRNLDNSFSNHRYVTTYKRRSFLDVYLCFLDRWVGKSRKEVADLFLDKEKIVIFVLPRKNDFINRQIRIRVAFNGKIEDPISLMRYLHDIGYIRLCQEQGVFLPDIFELKCVDMHRFNVTFTFDEADFQCKSLHDKKYR